MRYNKRILKLVIISIFILLHRRESKKGGGNYLEFLSHLFFRPITMLIFTFQFLHPVFKVIFVLLVSPSTWRHWDAGNFWMQNLAICWWAAWNVFCHFLIAKNNGILNQFKTNSCICKQGWCSNFLNTGQEIICVYDVDISKKPYHIKCTDL